MKQELCRAYRSLLKACSRIDPESYGHAEARLVQHAVYRMRSEKSIDLATADGSSVSPEKLEAAEKQMRDITRVLTVMQKLRPADAPSLFSFCTAAHVDAGSPEYHRAMESGLIRMARFHDAFRERLREEEQRGGEMKNRAMQVACREFAEALAVIDEGGAFKHKLSERKPHCAYYFFELPETVVVECDPDRKRTAVFVQSPTDIRENAYDERVVVQDWGLEPENVMFTEEYIVSAVRILKELLDAEALPTDHHIVLAGHSVGGAVAAILAVYLKHEHGFDITNVITFGQPSITSTVGCAPLMDLPLLRIVTPLDGFKDTPTGTAEGRVFVQYGEELSLLPAKLAELAADEDWVNENLVYVTMQEYNNLMEDDTAVLGYTPPPEHLAGYHGYGNITIQSLDELPKNEREKVIKERDAKRAGKHHARK